MAIPETHLARHEAGAIQVSETGFTMQGLAEVFVQSGFFKDVKAVSQAIVKVLYGKELGLTPIQSMLAIHMVDGKPELAAASMGALVKRSGRYDYRVKEHTAEACEIEFYEVRPDGSKEPIGTSRFDDEDVKRAGLSRAGSTHEKYPKAMKFARAMSQGVKWFCLDAIGGIPVYSEGELRDAGPARESNGHGEAPDVQPDRETTDEYMPRETGAPAPVAPAVASPDLTKPLAASIDQAREKKAAKGKTEQRVDRLLRDGKARETDSRGTDDAKGAKPPQTAGAQPGSGDTTASSAGAPAQKDAPAKEPSKAGDEPAPETDPDAEQVDQGGPEYLCVECSEPLGGELLVQRRGEWLHARCVARPDAAPAPASDDREVETEFVLHGNRYVTKGMTAPQMDASFKLTTQVDKAKGKGTSKGMLAKMLGLPVDDPKVSRLNLTEGKAAEFLKRMEAALSNAPAEQTALA